MNVTHTLYTRDFPYVYIGETITDKKTKPVHEYSFRFGQCIQLQLPVFIAPLVPTGTLQATVASVPTGTLQATVASVPTETIQAGTGHQSFS